MLRAGQDLPGAPTIQGHDVCYLRLRLIAEELMELADAMGYCIQLNNMASPTPLRDKPKERHTDVIERNLDWEPDLVEIADAFSDLNYVTVGGQSAFGIDGEPLDLEVHDSNMSKFIDGHKDEHGKWIKGPSTRVPDLAPILRAQGADC